MIDQNPPLPNGQIVDWDRTRYDADTERERSTRLKTMTSPRGPAEYYEACQPHERKRDKHSDYQPIVDHFVMGHLAHEYILEGKQNWTPSPHKRGSTGWKTAVTREVRDRTHRWIITDTQDREIRAWREAVLANADARKMFEAGRFSEQVILWDEEVEFIDHQGIALTTMIPMKAALDGLTFNAEILSLKTTAATNRDEWNRELRRFNYPFSEAFHSRGWQSLPMFAGHSPKVVHLIITKTDTPCAYLFPLSDDWLHIGKHQVVNALKTKAACDDYADQLRIEGKPVAEAYPDKIAETQSEPVEPEQWDFLRYGLEYAN